MFVLVKTNLIIQYTIYCIRYTVYCISHTYIIPYYFISYDIECIISYTDQCYGIPYTVYGIGHTGYDILYTLYRIQYTLYDKIVEDKNIYSIPYKVTPYTVYQYNRIQYTLYRNIGKNIYSIYCIRLYWYTVYGITLYGILYMFLPSTILPYKVYGIRHTVYDKMTVI